MDHLEDTDLAVRFLRDFSTKVRVRGYDYFVNGRVEIVYNEDGEVSADVHGKGGLYETLINLNDSEVTCDCPYFNDWGPCKHIWATILEVDSRQNSSGNAPTLATNRTVDDAGNRKPEKTRGVSLPTSSWMEHVGHVLRQQSLNQGDANRGLSAVATNKRELWYIIDVERSQAASALIIAMQFREPRANGQPGTIKDLQLNKKRLKEFADTEHYQPLKALLECAELGQPEISPYRYDYYATPSSHSRTTVPQVAVDRVLPLLAETNCLRWSLSDYNFSEDEQAQDRLLKWDSGSPWRFQLSFAEKRKDQQWIIEGFFQREGDVEDEPRSIRDAVLTVKNSFVLFPESVAPLESTVEDAWLDVLYKAGELRIPFSEREQFLRSIAGSQALSAAKFPVRFAGKQGDAECQPRLRFLKPDHLPPHVHKSPHVYGLVEFLYGDQVVSGSNTAAGIWDNSKSKVTWRNLEAERQYHQQLLEQPVGLITQKLRDLEEIELQVAVKELPQVSRSLIEEGWQVEAAGLQVRTPGEFNIGVTSGQDWFELNADFDFDGVSVDLPTLLQAVRNGDSFVKLGDGSQGLLPEEWIQRYGKIAGLGEVVNDSIRFRPSQAMILDALLDAQDGATRDRDFATFCRKLKKFSGIKPKAAPRTFRGDLRDYQKDGVGWLNFLRDFRLGGCLADDMGLGKTVQVLAMLESRRTRKLRSEETRKPSLVVVPKSLVFNWIAEAERFAPKLTIVNYTGIGRRHCVDDIPNADVVVTTYGTLRKDITDLNDVEFDYAILDEAQAIKNASSQAAKATRLIKADHRLAMTGTPVENHLGELWSLFEFLNPGMLGSSTAFKAISKTGSIDDSETENHVKTIAQALRPFMLRRTKEQVLTELPGKTEQTMYCEMPAKQRKLYNELRDYYRIQLDSKIKADGLKKSKIQVLEALLRLRQAACHPGLIDPKRKKEGSGKLDVAVEQLVQLASEGHKALVFSQFTSLLEIVKSRLDKEDITYEYLDGKTRKRQDRVERFQNDEECPLFLISLKAGGHGLNLTAADYVFILDPWWNPAVEAQAVDRAHRMGQQRQVFAYRLICKDTVEERILKMQEEKRQLADAIVSADGSLIKSLTAEDLQLLLS